MELSRICLAGGYLSNGGDDLRLSLLRDRRQCDDGLSEAIVADRGTSDEVHLAAKTGQEPLAD